MHIKLKATVAGLLLLIALPALHSSQCLAQVKNASAIAPAAARTKVITKTVDYGTLQKAIRKAGNSAVVLEVYPVKKSEDAGKNDFDALLVLRDAKNTSYPAKSVSTNDFNTQAGHYVEYYRKQNAAQESFPWGYQVVIDKAKVVGNGKLTLGIEALQRTITVQYTGGPGVKCDSCSKCPPQCSGGVSSQSMLMAGRMEKVIKRAYNKK